MDNVDDSSQVSKEEDTTSIAVGTTFPSMDAMKKQMKRFCTLEKHHYKITNTKFCLHTISCRYPRENQPSRHHCIDPLCNNEQCEHKKTKPIPCCFKISGTLSMKGYAISHFEPNHDCALQKDWIQQTSPVVKSSFVHEKIAESFSDNPGIKPSEIMARTLREDGLRVKYHTAWRAKRKAKLLYNGDLKATFSKIPSFLQQVNDEIGSNAFYECVQESEDQKCFSRCFVCYRACKNALMYCKPLLFLDACHVRNPYNGVILVACSSSGANETVVLAFGLAEVENSYNWSWFMRHLTESNPLLNSKPLRSSAIERKASKRPLVAGFLTVDTASVRNIF